MGAREHESEPEGGAFERRERSRTFARAQLARYSSACRSRGTQVPGSGGLDKMSLLKSAPYEVTSFYFFCASLAQVSLSVMVRLKIGLEFRVSGFALFGTSRQK